MIVVASYFLARLPIMGVVVKELSAHTCPDVTPHAHEGHDAWTDRLCAEACAQSRQGLTGRTVIVGARRSTDGAFLRQHVFHNGREVQPGEIRL